MKENIELLPNYKLLEYFENSIKDKNYNSTVEEEIEGKIPIYNTSRFTYNDLLKEVYFRMLKD